MQSRIVQRLETSALAAFWRSISPAGQAVISFAIPFSLLDALHFYTAGSALLISLLLGSISLGAALLPDAVYLCIWPPSRRWAAR